MSGAALGVVRASAERGPGGGGAHLVVDKVVVEQPAGRFLDELVVGRVEEQVVEVGHARAWRTRPLHQPVVTDVE